jgi:exosortase/archaeosortase family protein
MTQLVDGPSIGLRTWSGPLGGGGAWLDRWHDGRPRIRTAAKMAALLGAIVCAYGYSLATLVQTATMQTPLAYVSLVPLIALGLATMRRNPAPGEPPIHDRQLDYIVGLPLLGAAIAMNLVLPGRFSAMFWVWRIDLLSLPIFVAGAVAVIFGVRVMWRQKLAIAYLLLAWPWPYTTALLRVLNASTTATLAGLRLILRVVPVAAPVAGGDGSVFQVVHNGHPFPVSVVSACSGINGIVGFLLVGVAFSAIVRGPRARKGLWLAGGMVVLWVINLLRLAFIFWAGKEWGEGVAINVLHPFVGLLTFSAGVLLMLVVMRPLGMTIGPVARRGAGPTSPRDPRGHVGAVAVPRAFAAFTVVAVAALVLGTADNGLRAYDLVANAAGEPRLLSFHSSPATPQGWRLRVTETIDWAKPLFGDDSTWTRYLFVPSRGGDFHSAYGVTADVIDTSDQASFSAYGVESCYQFHGWLLRDVAQVNIGGGITGQTLSFSAGSTQSWSVVYWIVPVKVGQDTRYERFVLYLLDAPGGAHVQLPPGVRITNLAGSITGSGGTGAVLAQNRSFLVAFAHQLIVRQAHRAAVVTAHIAAAAGDTAGGGGSALRPLAADNSSTRAIYPS